MQKAMVSAFVMTQCFRLLVLNQWYDVKLMKFEGECFSYFVVHHKHLGQLNVREPFCSVSFFHTCSCFFASLH